MGKMLVLRPDKGVTMSTTLCYQGAWIGFLNNPTDLPVGIDPDLRIVDVATPVGEQVLLESVAKYKGNFT